MNKPKHNSFKAGDTVIIKCQNQVYAGKIGKIVAVLESGHCQVALGKRAVLNLPPEGMEHVK